MRHDPHRREDLPAVHVNRYFQVHGLLRLQHLDNYVWWVLLIVCGIGIGLREGVVSDWPWVGPFIGWAKGVFPVVDAFWRVSPFPTIAQLLPAIAWLIAIAAGPAALLTVKHLRFAGMYEPANTFNYWLGVFALLGFIVLMGWVGGLIEPHDFAKRRFPWPILNYAVHNQVAFSVLAGTVAGLLAACWGALCIVAVRRLLPSLLRI
jgi:hypothetical protein